MDLNRFGLDTVLTVGTESFTPEVELTTGTESITEEQLGTEIHELVEANESLDRMLHTGLVDGLESVSETLKLVQLSDVFHTMESIAAGTESYDSDMAGLESALRYAGVDLSSIAGYEAGTEAREGGIAQPFRDAGSKIKGSKAYKAVSDSFVGKATKSVLDKIKKFFGWLKEKLFGKEKQYNTVLEKYKAENPELAAEVSKMESDLAQAIKEKDYHIANLTKKWKAAEGHIKSNAKEIGKIQQAADQKVETLKADLVLIKAAQQKEIAKMKEKYAEAKKEGRRRIKAINEDLQGVTAENTSLRKENTALKERESELMNGGFEAIKAEKDNNKALMALVVGLLGQSGSSPASAAVSTEVVETVTPIAEAVPETAPVVAEILANETTIQNLRTQTAATIQKEAGQRLSKKDLKKLNNIKGGAGSRKRGGNLSEEYDISSFINFGIGVESESFHITEEYEEAVESIDPFIIEDLASYDMLMAIDAGVECMNIDVFGHPYTGVDMKSLKIVAFTDRYDLGEAGVEAEETKKDGEKPSETAKKEEAKEEGFFAKAGNKFKRAGKWMGAKGRQFWKWLKSKLTILEPIMDKLAMMTSKSFDLSTLNENELGSALASIDANIEKVAKLLDKEHNESVKSAEEYTKIIAESKKKVSSSMTVSPIRLIGASDLLKKIRKISKAVKNASDNKAENAAEMTSIMTETNKAIAAFNLQIRRAIRNVKKADDTTKDLPNKEEK